MNRTLFPLALAGAFLCATAANATLVQFNTPFGMDASQEVSPVNSPGVGNALLIYDTATLELTVNVNFADLVAPATAAHIHAPADPGSNAPVAIPLVGFPAATSGTYHNVFDLSDVNSFNPTFVANAGGTADAARTALLSWLTDGRAYANIHTSEYPGGEIRGQLRIVPEPATLALLGLGAAAAFARRRFS